MLKRFTLAATVIALSFVLYPSLASAQEITNETTAVAPEAALTLSDFTVVIIISILIPLVTALVTKYDAKPAVKQVITLALSIITGLVTTATQVDGTAVISLTSAKYALLSFLTAAVAYVYGYEPHDVNAKVAPNSGLS